MSRRPCSTSPVPVSGWAKRWSRGQLCGGGSIRDAQSAPTPPPHWTRFAILPSLTRTGYAPPHWLTRHESPDLLVLTKMMRGADPEDLSDIAFLLQHGPATDAELRATFANVRLPDIHELRDAFRTAQPKVRVASSSDSPVPGRPCVRYSPPVRPASPTRRVGRG